MALVSLAAALASFGWGLALGFALAVVVVVSLFVVITLPKDALGLGASAPRGRAFKDERVTVELLLTSKKGSSLAQFDLSYVPDGLEASITGGGATRTLEVTSRYAGVFSGLKVRVGIMDPLGIFARNEVHDIKVSFEFLPTFLLAKNEPIRVTAAILGDYPAGRRGFGQEFYSAESYSQASSSKDILWKRQAKNPEEDLLVRVGEANIPERLTVCFLEKQMVPERKSPRWMDLASEAMARVGLSVISAGTTLRVVHVLGEETTVFEAKDPGSLANLLVDLWRDGRPREKWGDHPSLADMVVTAESETSSPDVMGLVQGKPSILLGWGQRKKGALGYGVVFFSGQEDVSGLVAAVLSR